MKKIAVAVVVTLMVGCASTVPFTGDITGTWDCEAKVDYNRDVKFRMHNDYDPNGTFTRTIDMEIHPSNKDIYHATITNDGSWSVLGSDLMEEYRNFDIDFDDNFPRLLAEEIRSGMPKPIRDSWLLKEIDSDTITMKVDELDTMLCRRS